MLDHCLFKTALHDEIGQTDASSRVDFACFCAPTRRAETERCKTGSTRKTSCWMEQPACASELNCALELKLQCESAVLFSMQCDAGMMTWPHVTASPFAGFP